MVLKNTGVRNVTILAGIGLTLSVLVVIAGTGSSHVIRNGGFETKATDHAGPYAWSTTKVPQTKDFVAFAWDDQVSHAGTRSASISIDESHPDVQIDYNWNQAVREYDPGETYKVTGWIRAHNLESTAFIVVQCWDSTFAEMLDLATTQRDYQVTGTTEWIQIEITISIPVKTGNVMILAGIRAPDNRGGKVWFDDIKFTRATKNPRGPDEP